MPDITKEGTSSKAAESHNDELFRDAYNFCADTIAHPDARARQAAVVSYGTLIGGIKDIPNEFCNHPADTTKKAAVAAAAGVATGALLEIGSVPITIGTIAGGSFMLGVGFKNSWDKACNDTGLSKALSATWKNSDLATTISSAKVAEERLGPEAFDYGLGLIAGCAGAKFSPSITSKFKPKTAWQGLQPKDWTIQPDGTKININEFGDKMTEYPDGTMTEELPGVSTETFHPNGELTRDYVTGLKTIDRNDGSQELYYPDGRQLFVGPRGHRIIKLPNGTTINQSPNGDTTVRRADGSLTNRQFDGYVYNHYANGDSLHIDLLGRKTFYSHAESELYAIKPTGEKVRIIPGNPRPD